MTPIISTLGGSDVTHIFVHDPMLAVFLLIVGVQEPPSTRPGGGSQTGIQLSDLQWLVPALWWVVVFGALLTLARFSEAFLVLRSAYPAGRLADKMSRRPLLVAGCLFLMVADGILAVAGDVVVVMIGVAFWGIHMGLTQGLLPPSLRMLHSLSFAEAPSLFSVSSAVWHSSVRVCWLDSSGTSSVPPSPF